MAMPKYTFAKDGAALDKIIDSAVRGARSARSKIQVAAIAILYHAYQHGDYTGAGKLVLGLDGSGVRRDALVEFFKIFGGLTVNEDKDTKQEKPFCAWKGADYIKEHFEEAKKTMWSDCKKEKDPFVELDFNQDLLKLIGRYTKQLKKAEEAGEEFRGKISVKIADETMNHLKALVNTEAEVVEDKDEVVADKLEQLLNGDAA